MPNMNDFFKNEVPTMILNAIMEAAEEAKKEEAKVNTKTNANHKAPTEELVKRAAALIGEEACNIANDFSAGLYYTYSSFIDAGFSATQAFELTKCTLIG
ncbi:MAG: hypothetical protein Q4D26_07565 [Clostridia bacterium]|nr:hypothetical protein [Clostridia bacterium]